MPKNIVISDNYRGFLSHVPRWLTLTINLIKIMGRKLLCKFGVMITVT